jgi:hypothetical protein
LLVTWVNLASGNQVQNTEWPVLLTTSEGTAVYTAGWAASAKSEVHSQQKFSCAHIALIPDASPLICRLFADMGHKGEIRVDQAHRGYEVATDENGYVSSCLAQNQLICSGIPTSTLSTCATSQTTQVASRAR